MYLIICNFKCFTSSGKFLLLIDVTLVVVPLTDWESLLTPLILIDEVAPDRIPEGLGWSDWGWLWFKDCCLGDVLTLLEVVVLGTPIPDAIEDNPAVSSSDGLLAEGTFVSKFWLPTLKLEYSLWACVPVVTVIVVLVTGIVLRKEGGVEDDDDPPKMGGYWGGDGESPGVSSSTFSLPSGITTGGFEAIEEDLEAEPDDGGPAFWLGLDILIDGNSLNQPATIR